MQIGLGIGIPFIRNYISRAVAEFTPAQLFSDPSTQGVWYDPSDFTTLFQDAAGTTPVTAVEQPVGLMLDKSKGLVLGPELVTNGDFSNGTTGWTFETGWAVVSGQAVKSIGSNAYIYQNNVLTLGKWYEVTIDVLSVSGGGLIVYTAYGGAIETQYGISAPGTYRLKRLSGVGFPSTRFGVYATSSVSAVVDNISVRELPGNHAFNPSGNSANFPVLSARYNLLTKTEDISAADWTKGGATAASTSSLLETATTGAHSCTLSPTTVAATYIYSVKLKANGRTRFAIAGSANFGGNLGNGIFFDLSTGSYVSGATGTPSITALADGWYQVTYTWAALAGSGPLGVYLVDSGTNTSYTGDVTKGMFIKEADLRVSNDALNQPAYQRVNTSTDYDTVGFKPYLRFNGTNQWLQTNSIDFTNTAQMFVSAGFRQLTESSQGIVGTDPITLSGSFLLYGETAGNTMYLNKASAAYAKVSKPTPPYTRVTAHALDLAGLTYSTQYPVVRVNGSASSVTYAGALTGTGNFANAPLAIGRYASSNYFNGHLYQLVIAGKQASANEITNTETFVNQKTGAWS